MSVTVYDKEGKPVVFTFPIDAKESVATGQYTYEPPEGREQEELSSEEYTKRVELTERARLGGPVSPEERTLLVEHDTPDFRKEVVGIEERYPNDRAPVGEEVDSVNAQAASAPGSTEVVDTFNPAMADRDELFGYLRERGDSPGGATSTDNLRSMVYAKMGTKEPASSEE